MSVDKIRELMGFEPLPNYEFCPVFQKLRETGHMELCKFTDSEIKFMGKVDTCGENTSWCNDKPSNM